MKEELNWYHVSFNWQIGGESGFGDQVFSIAPVFKSSTTTELREKIKQDFREQFGIPEEENIGLIIISISHLRTCTKEEFYS